MTKIPFPCGRAADILYRTVFGRRTGALASTILFNSGIIYENKNRKPVARRHIVETSLDPRTGPARGPHGYRTVIMR